MHHSLSPEKAERAPRQTMPVRFSCSPGSTAQRLQPNATSAFRGLPAQYVKAIAVWNARRSAPQSELPVTGRLIGYGPAPAFMPAIGSPKQALARSRANPLRVPIREGLNLDGLVAAYAPLLEVDEADRNDRIGTPMLGTQGAARVDTSRPTMFVRTGHARFLRADLGASTTRIAPMG